MMFPIKMSSFHALLDNAPLVFEQHELVLVSDNHPNGMDIRITNLEGIQNYLYGNYNRDLEVITFHLIPDFTTSPLFTVQKLKQKKTFRIIDHRNYEEIQIKRVNYLTGEKYEFQLPDGTKSSWKSMDTNWKLVTYPEKETKRGFLRPRSATKIGKSVSSTVIFTPAKDYDPWYHFSWLTAFASTINWDAL
jgi:hypothetical protein